MTAIAAPSRYRVAVRGRQDHAGGTPMADRRDAVAAAAELVLLVERLAREAGRGMVGTVGFLEARPNMINIVPGEADLLVDFRGIEPAAIAETLARFETEAAAVATRRGVEVEWTSLMRDAPLTVAPAMVAVAEGAASAVGAPWRRLTSGASHDANHMARLCPVGLLFIPAATVAATARRSGPRPTTSRREPGSSWRSSSAWIVTWPDRARRGSTAASRRPRLRRPARGLEGRS